MVDLNAPDSLTRIRHELQDAGAERIFYIADAFRAGLSMDGVFKLTKIDPRFWCRLKSWSNSKSR